MTFASLAETSFTWTRSSATIDTWTLVPGGAVVVELLELAGTRVTLNISPSSSSMEASSAGVAPAESWSSSGGEALRPSRRFGIEGPDVKLLRGDRSEDGGLGVLWEGGDSTSSSILEIEAWASMRDEDEL